MKGSLCHELEVGLPAGEIWEVYGTLRLARLAVELLPNILQKADIVHGDGGVGTVLHLTFPPGNPGPQYYKEKFTKVDNDNYVKEAVVIEGGYLELGFTSYLVRFEIVKKDGDSSVIRSSIEYEIDDENAGNASFVTTGPLVSIAEAISSHLMKQKSAGRHYNKSCT
ncbi:S-norcoclaurine synthase 2-like [Ananas comosus]|uniref:S-norcoclaurine synthase 2-like n=1 Tax=Ananas comosus TaxID=4615 RepID=A0A6P5ERG2_ANACO|nr:S-norcoclaurine synthase 2-like [Ananas comosus]